MSARGIVEERNDTKTLAELPTATPTPVVLGVGLARRAGDRYPSTTAFADALRAALHGDGDATIESEWG